MHEQTRERSPLRSWGTVMALACLATVFRVFGCGAGVVNDPTDGYDKQGLLRSLGERVILPTYTGFLGEVEALDGAIAAWRAAIPLGDATTEREAAQEGWRQAMSRWQRAEVLQLGPAGAAQNTLGGLDLRDEIYSWPTVNPCRIDQELVADTWDDASFFDDNLVNVYGLDALEYLLFREDEGNACPPQVEINSDGGWDALLASGLDTARASYAQAVATHVVAVAGDLVQRWEPGGGDFITELADAGMTGSVYADPSEALGEVFDALFYLELVAKDRKLGRPLGLLDCVSATCPEELESQQADAALSHLRDNLLGGRALLSGGDAEGALGFNDLLRYVDEGQLAQDLLDTLDAAVATIDGVDQSAILSLQADPAELQGVYEALGAFTDLLKGEFALVLLLEVPAEAAGDND